MPKEYEECVKSYKKKGVSERSAKARCAAMFYKRHGITVNEWVKKHGEGEMHEYDEEMFKSIISAMGYGDKMKNEENTIFANVKRIDATMIEDNVIEIAAAMDGSIAFTAEGISYTWTGKALNNAQKTWNQKHVTINHTDDVHGEIKYSWFDESDKMLHQIIKLDEFLKGWVIRNIEDDSLGVSIEALLLDYDDNRNILEAEGLGVTIVLPPHRPACSPEQGCKVLGTCENESQPLNNNEESEKREGEDSGTISDNKEVDIMSEDKDCTKITAEDYEKLVSEKEKVISDKEQLIQEMEAMKAKVEELEAFKIDTVKKEHEMLLAKIKDMGLDASIYEKNDNEALKIVVATAESMKKVIEDDEIQDSGATMEATDKTQEKSEEEKEADEVWAYVYGENK